MIKRFISIQWARSEQIITKPGLGDHSWREGDDHQTRLPM